MTEGGEKAPVHLIDNRCKSPSKGVKGRCSHGNSVWVNAKGLGAGLGLGVRELRGRWGQGSEVITAAFLDKGTTSPSLHLPPDGCWCRELLWRDGVDLDTTPTATATKPHWPLQQPPRPNLICCYNGGRGSAVAQADPPHAHHPSVFRPCTRGHSIDYVRTEVADGTPDGSRWPLMVFISKVQCRWNGCLTLIQ